MALSFKQERWGVGEMSHSAESRVTATQQNLKAKVGFSICKVQPPDMCVISFVSRTSFSSSFSWAEATNVLSAGKR